MMRIPEFIEIERLLVLDMFDRRRTAKQDHTSDLGGPPPEASESA